MIAADDCSPPQPESPLTPDARAGLTRPLLLEVSWEACTQVGGIYTVLRSKAPVTVRRWGDDYCVVGPYREASARIEVEPQPLAGPLAAAVADLRAAGAGVHVGRWLITGRPQVILLHPQAGYRHLNDTKYFLWRDHGIDSARHDPEFDEVVAFGVLVADLLEAIRRHLPDRPLLAQFHEWQGAAALPLLARRPVRVASVFTTHATLVGRGLSAADANLYDDMGRFDADGVARDHGIAARHGLERAAARLSDAFTTVSSVTGVEARQFLGRAPDVVLPNGLNVERYTAPHEFQVLHQQSKELIHEFVMGHFFPSYTFDLDRTLYVFTAGRYEYRNKGLDVFIEALHELNRRMQADQASSTVVAFIITRAPYRAPNVETLNRHAMFHELRDVCASIKEEIGRRLFRTVSLGRLPRIEDLLDDYANVRLKRVMYAWRQGTPPTIVTHDLYDDRDDPVLRHLRHRGLWNKPEDRVKVVFHPEFMSVASPLLAMDYDQFVRGCHVGVFPSYYEPWGYTPMECVVRGVPAITSDLAGFGHYVAENLPDHDVDGIYVARRRGMPFDATVQQVADWLYQVSRMSRRERIALRNRVESYAEVFDWNQLSRHYVEAQDAALQRRYGVRGLVPPDPEGGPDPAVVPRRGRAPGPPDHE